MLYVRLEGSCEGWATHFPVEQRSAGSAPFLSWCFRIAVDEKVQKLNSLYVCVVYRLVVRCRPLDGEPSGISQSPEGMGPIVHLGECEAGDVANRDFDGLVWLLEHCVVVLMLGSGSTIALPTYSGVHGLALEPPAALAL